jgi:hypothetical protein
MVSPWSRILLGYLIAPLLAPATYLAFAWATGGFLSFDLALQYGEFAYAASLIAVPAFLLLAHIGWDSLHDFIVFGFLMGFIGGSIPAEKPLGLSLMPLLAFYGLCGAAASAGFWAIARPKKEAR